MPMIDVYADSTLFPKESRKTLGLDLTKAVIHAEGVAQPRMFHLRNTAAPIHELISQSANKVDRLRGNEICRLAKSTCNAGPSSPTSRSTPL